MTFEMLIFWAATLVPGTRPSVMVHINTGEAVEVARRIARDEGYDLDHEVRSPGTGEKIAYWFDSLDGSPQGPLLEGYTSIGFYINTHVRSGISINNSTGQTLDMTSCELFDYPDLRPFQEQVMRLSGAAKKTPQELADEVGCESLRIDSKPVVLFWVARRVSARRRQARFEALAQAFGRHAVREGEFLSRFPIEVAGREVEVRYQHIGGRSGAGGWTPDWYLVTVVPLRGVSDLHSVDIAPRPRRVPRGVEDAVELEEHFSVRDTGYPLREGWLDRRTRGAIQNFYALDLPVGRLAIEESKLIHRARSPLRTLGRDALLSLLTRQAEIATAIERAV